MFLFLLGVYRLVVCLSQWFCSLVCGSGSKVKPPPVSSDKKRCLSSGCVLVGCRQRLRLVIVNLLFARLPSAPKVKPPKVCLKPNGLLQCQTFSPFLGIFFVFSGKGFCLHISVFQVFAYFIPH